MTEHKHEDFRDRDGMKQEYFAFQDAENSDLDWSPSEFSTEEGFDPLESKIIARMPDLGEGKQLPSPKNKEASDFSKRFQEFRRRAAENWSLFYRKTEQWCRDWASSEQRRRNALIGLAVFCGLLLFAGTLVVLRDVVFPDAETVAVEENVDPNLAGTPQEPSAGTNDAPVAPAASPSISAAPVTPPPIPEWAMTTPPVAEEVTLAPAESAAENKSASKPNVQVIGTAVASGSPWERTVTDGYSPYHRPAVDLSTAADTNVLSDPNVGVAMTPMRRMDDPATERPANALGPIASAVPATVVTPPNYPNDPAAFQSYQGHPSPYTTNPTPQVFAQDYQQTQQRIGVDVPRYQPGPAMTPPYQGPVQGAIPVAPQGYYQAPVYPPAATPAYQGAQPGMPQPMMPPGGYSPNPPQNGQGYPGTRVAGPAYQPSPAGVHPNQYRVPYTAQAEPNPYTPYAPMQPTAVPGGYQPGYQPGYPAAVASPETLRRPDNTPYQRLF